MSATGYAFMAALQALAAAVVNASADPADALRLAVDLAQPTQEDGGLAAPSGSNMARMRGAVADGCRRSAVIALARAAARYQPASHDDALQVRALVCSVLDAEITAAGDQGEDATFNALRKLRASVITDLTQRGADLAPIATFVSADTLPSLVLAQRHYGDAGRETEMVTQVNPRHPLFMPVQFKALAS